MNVLSEIEFGGINRCNCENVLFDIIRERDSNGHIIKEKREYNGSVLESTEVRYAVGGPTETKDSMKCNQCRVSTSIIKVEGH